MEGRLTVCNMSIEGGARAGMVAPDDTTFAYVEGKPHAPAGADWERALDHWRTLPTDPGATFDEEVEIDASTLRPYVSWGTNPAQSVTIDDVVPDPADNESARRALRYMDLEPGTAIRDIRPDTIFIGSCTNSRIEDLRVAAAVVGGKTGRERSACARRSRERRREASGRARGAGPDLRGRRLRVARRRLLDVSRHEPRHPVARRPPASTSNRNFEGRQGKGGRTHLVSPRVAAATAIAGHFTTPEDL